MNLGLIPESIKWCSGIGPSNPNLMDQSQYSILLTLGSLNPIFSNLGSIPDLDWDFTVLHGKLCLKILKSFSMKSWKAFLISNFRIIILTYRCNDPQSIHRILLKIHNECYCLREGLKKKVWNFPYFPKPTPLA